jgi:predicted Rossmann fold flavoprotein
MDCNTLILGAGAAGLFAAAHAGHDTLVVDHAAAPAEKVRISGGGRCNFTNTRTTAANFLSDNSHFAKSALSRYTPADFIALVDAHRIPWHEKALGQLFCDRTSRDIVTMLTGLVRAAGADLWLRTTVVDITHDGARFTVKLNREGRDITVAARHLIVATGGKSIPKMGATGLAYRIAAQFGLDVTDTRPALVPFTFGTDFATLAGISAEVSAVAARGPAFREAMLFTHRGLSGPAMLQISSFWHEGEDIILTVLPAASVTAILRAARSAHPKRSLKTALTGPLPARLADFLDLNIGGNRMLASLSDRAIADVADTLSRWTLRPTGTEGYRTAEVTLGGVDTSRLSSRTMEATTQPGLFFVGECLDVTGWLGGYNFQWAWASAHAAATAIRGRA